MSDVSGVRLVGQSDRDVPAGDGWLSDGERAELARFTVEKRRHDWRLRRWTAKRAIALSAGDVPAARITVDHTDDGAPLPRVDGRPAPLGLSVSDSHGWAVAANGPAGHRIGCDVELVEPRSDAFLHDFLTDAEQRAVTAAAAHDHETANVVWSAKESALKALGVGLDRPTRSVHVDLVDGGERGWHPLRVTSDRDGVTLDGWWQRVGTHVVTVVADSATGPPVFVTLSAPGSR
jgi:4'-phosphopantetheinyl transferase